jgi:mannose-6-phosphate isomerase-like protein (cupin superfamily)
MVIQRSEMKSEKKDKMRDGEGTVAFNYLVVCEKEKNVRMLAELTLPPGASIGYHSHEKETEYFIFISGEGVANDNGVETQVKAGDFMSTGNGAYHSVKNTGTVPLVFSALIVTY